MSVRDGHRRTGPVVEGVQVMLGDKLGEASGTFTAIRVLPTEGAQIWLEVSFQGRGELLGQEISDTGTYRQTIRPEGVLYGEGHVLMTSPTGDVADWVGGGVGRPTGPGHQASFGVAGSFHSATGRLAAVTEVADVIEYEVEEDGSYHWTMWAWSGSGVPAAQRSAKGATAHAG
jgi:hypothetical protein